MLSRKLQGAGSSKPITVSFIQGTYYKGFNGSITLPTGIQDGDLLFMSDCLHQRGNYTTVYANQYRPSGWSQVGSCGGLYTSPSYVTSRWIYKVASAADSGATLSGLFPRVLADWYTVAVLVHYRPSGSVAGRMSVPHSGWQGAYGSAQTSINPVTYDTSAQDATQIYLAMTSSLSLSTSELLVSGITEDYRFRPSDVYEICAATGYTNNPTAGAVFEFDTNDNWNVGNPTHTGAVVRFT